MKWWQKKVKGWVVPFWYSDTPLVSKRAVEYGLDKLADQIRKDRSVNKEINNLLKSAVGKK